jgi:hypothetical protein
MQRPWLEMVFTVLNGLANFPDIAAIKVKDGVDTTIELFML